MLFWSAIITFDQSGNLLWTLGGITSDYSGASWDSQHGHDWLTNSVLLFNNNNQGNSGSSAIEYELNGSSANIIYDYSSENSTQSLGDVSRLPNGNTLVTYSNAGLIHEADSNAQLVQAMTIGDSISYTVRRATLYGPPPPYSD